MTSTKYIEAALIAYKIDQAVRSDLSQGFIVDERDYVSSLVNGIRHALEFIWI